MAGLLSPKPVSYYQQQHSPSYNPYINRGLSAYSETPPLAGGANLLPHQQIGQYGGTTTPGLSLQDDGKIAALVVQLLDHNTREGALLELSKKREQYDDLALILWHSFGASP